MLLDPSLFRRRAALSNHTGSWRRGMSVVHGWLMAGISTNWSCCFLVPWVLYLGPDLKLPFDKLCVIFRFCRFGKTKLLGNCSAAHSFDISRSHFSFLPRSRGWPRVIFSKWWRFLCCRWPLLARESQDIYIMIIPSVISCNLTGFLPTVDSIILFLSGTLAK